MKDLGYSIMTPFKNENEQKIMKEFMGKEFVPFYRLIQPLNLSMIEGYQKDFPPYENLNYGPRKNVKVLGFNYNHNEAEINYFFSICYWMAIHGGKRKKFKGEENIPYVLYDGKEAWAIYAGRRQNKEVQEKVETDEIGYRKMPYLQESMGFGPFARTPELKKEFEKVDEATKKELQRLTEEWKKYKK